MTKSELIAELATANPHLRGQDVETIVATIFEEITFALKRTHKVVVNTEENVGQAPSSGSAATSGSDDDHPGARHVAAPPVTSQRLSAKHVDDLSLAQAEPQPAVTGREGPAEVRAADGPRQLPPAE